MNSKKTHSKTITNNNLIDRTAFTLPEDWSDIEKLYLVFKVLDADCTIHKSSYNNDEEDLLFRIYNAVMQALVVLPIKKPQDIFPKLKVMEYCMENHLYDEKHKLVISRCEGLELEAKEICEQLTKVTLANYTALQQLYWAKEKRTNHSKEYLESNVED